MNSSDQKPIEEPGPNNDFLSTHIDLLIKNYLKFVCRPFPVGGSDPISQSKNIYQTNRYVVMSHDTQSDPIFNYANIAAQKLWQLNWQQFIQMPSRLSAEPSAREERRKLLDTVTRQGFIDNYSGIRISSTRQKFFIEKATIWNIYNFETKEFYGQAVIFNQWHLL